MQTQERDPELLRAFVLDVCNLMLAVCLFASPRLWARQQKGAEYGPWIARVVAPHRSRRLGRSAKGLVDRQDLECTAASMVGDVDVAQNICLQFQIIQPTLHHVANADYAGKLVITKYR
jgi:hypothetical protein